MARVKITSNLSKFRASVENMGTYMNDIAESAAKSLLLSSFEIVLSNSPADTGQFISNWHVYKQGGLRGFDSNGGISSPHERYDYAGRLSTHDNAVLQHMGVIEAEVRALNLNLLDSDAKQQVTIGVSNSTPYANVLDKGTHPYELPLVNLTAGGYSIQAPSGIVQISISEASASAGTMNFGQILNVGGSI